MKENYFIIDNIKYVITYQNFSLEIYKLVDNEKEELTEEEKVKIYSILKKNDKTTYESQKLNEILETNVELNKSSYIPNLLEWLESVIPENSRDNFYRNIETLKVSEVNGFENANVIGEYDTLKNEIRYNPTETDDDKKVASTILHELAHMASTNYNLTTSVVNCGYDTLTPDFRKRNRGLTEGLTQVITEIGIPSENKMPAYDIEGLIACQIGNIVNTNVLLESYFSNKGTEVLEEKFAELGHDKDKAFRLFRDIEINYNFRNDCLKQNVLGNIQSTLIDYFDERLQEAFLNSGHEIEILTGLLNGYEKALITEEKLSALGKDNIEYEGLKESVEKFAFLKDKYVNLMGIFELDKNIVKEPEITTKKAGFSNVLILGLVTGIISLALVLLGIYLTV